MLNKRLSLTRKNFLLLLYLIILGLFGPIVYWLHSGNEPRPEKLLDNQVQSRISLGEQILITADNNPDKRAGVEAFADGDYVTALTRFEAALKSNPNDPEALIYLNNTAAARTNQNVYRIAVSVPIGGNLDVAKEILRGVAQAQNEINQGTGINGSLVTIEIANDDNNSDIALEIANRFVNNDEILAVIGHNSSNVSLTVAPVYQKGQLVMITPTSSADNLSKIGDYIFRTTPNTRALSQPLADYTVNTLKKTNIAICFDSESESIKSFKDEFTWSTFVYGGKIAPVDCDFSASDFLASEIPSKLISSGADALLLAPSLHRIDDAIAVARANEERLTLLGSHTLNTYSTLKQGQDATKGMVLAVAWNPLVKPNNDFAVDARNLWGGPVNWRTAMSYDAAKTLFEGLEARDSRKGLQQVLKNPDFNAEGTTSKISFFPSGDRNLRGTLIEVQPGQRSGTGYDFVPLQPDSNQAQ